MAFEAASHAAMLDFKARLEAADRPVFGPVNHDFVQSIYFWDPDGLPLEITARVDDHDAIMAHESEHARDVLRDWTARTATQKAAF